MRTIAFINQKGGVGKTTTAVNVSAALAASGHRVQLIDLDPQAHATLHVGAPPDRHDPSVYDVLTANVSLADVRRRVDDNLSIVGSSIDLAAAEIELAGVVARELILRDKLAEDTAQFDYTIVDCPPSLGLLTLNALSAVEEVIIPLQPHFLALHGLSKLLDTVQIVSRRINPRLRVRGVVLCLYDSGTRLASEVAENVTEFFAHTRDPRTPWCGAGLFDTRIRKNIRLAEAPSHGQTIFQYAASSNGADDYRRLADELHAAQVAAPAEPVFAL